MKLSRFEHQGQPALHALVRDITERKEYERQLEEQRDNLQILNQVLRHDIRNDIQLIMSYSELLKTECDDEELTEYIQTVLESADHAVELTTSARQMANVMLSTEEELAQVDLHTVLETEILEVREAYSDVEIARETTIPEVSVQANTMLGSIFRNLLKNAIQHNDKETPRVAVSATDREDDVVVRFADNGPGVSDNRKDSIFGKGEKGLDSQGTGFGLYLVETLMDSYGGDIRVQDRSESGFAGTQFEPVDGVSNDNEPSEEGGEGAVFIVELPKAGQ